MTDSLLKSSSKFSLTSTGQEVFKFIVKRLLRFWPTFLAVSILCYLLDDFNARNFNQPLMNSVFMLPIGKHTPVSFGVSWSNRVDVECGVILILTICVMRYFNLLDLKGSFAASILSILPKLMRFLNDPGISYLQLGRNVKTVIRDKFIPIFINLEKQLWLKNLTGFPEVINPQMHEMSDLKRQLISEDYLVTHQRITPFFVGMILFIALKKASVVSKDKTRRSLFSQLFHSTSLFLTVVVLLWPFVMGLKRGRSVLDDKYQPSNISFTFDLIFNVFGRTIYSAANAYILYRTLISKDSIYHLKSAKWFLELPIIQFMGKMSFGVYMSHYIYVVYFALIIFPSKFLDETIGKNLLYHFLLYLILSYISALGTSYLILNAFEKPLKPFCDKIINILFPRHDKKE